MTDTIIAVDPATDTVAEAPVIETPAIPTLPAGQEPDVIIYTRRNQVGVVFKTTDESSLIAITPGTGRMGHVTYLTEEQVAWVRSLNGVNTTWVAETDIRRLGTHPEPHRFFDEEDDWRWTEVATMIQQGREALRLRVIEGLREQKSENDWCSELEEQWLPKMGIRRPEFRQSPEYRTFEVEVTMSVSSTVSNTRTVTVAVNGDDDETVRERAEEAAVDAFRDDLRGEVDLGHSGYYMASLSYETEDTSTESEFDSDEDGCEIDDDE